MSFWNDLGISPTKDLKTIKTAYAKKLKLYHPEDNPEMFKVINQAYNSAVKFARQSNVTQYQQNEIDINKQDNTDNENSNNKEVQIEKLQSTNYSDVISESINNYLESKQHEMDSFIEQIFLIDNNLKDRDAGRKLDYILKHDEFSKYKDDEYFLSKLEEVLRNYNGPKKYVICSELYYAYDFYQIENYVDQGVYQNLYDYLKTIIRPVKTKTVAKGINKSKINKAITIFVIYFINMLFLGCISAELCWFAIIVVTPIVIFTLISIKSFIKIRKRFKEHKKKNTKTFILILLFSVFTCVDIFWIITTIVEFLIE